MERARATLIRRYPFSETSLLIHWCSREHGLIKTMARGGARPKSPFRGKLDLFFEAEIQFVRSRRSDLHTLRDCDVVKPRLPLRQSYSRTLASAYFIELLELVAEKETPIEPLHDLLDRALDHLSKSDVSLRALLFFEKEVAGYLGLGVGKNQPIEAISGMFGQAPSSRAELVKIVNA
ncbi:MAG: DNA repair protein RecO [Verrucomicrobiota bacterium]